jgi:hypothetical protein
VRAQVFVAILSLTAIGCMGDDDATVDAGDLGRPDLPASCGDPKLSCGGYLSCIVDCHAAGASDAGIAACAHSCELDAADGKPEKFQTAFVCGERHCLGDVDAGSGACIDSANGPVNRDESAPTQGTQCGDCLNDSLAGLFGDACVSPGGPDCKPAECAAAIMECLTDIVMVTCR